MDDSQYFYQDYGTNQDPPHQPLYLETVRGYLSAHSAKSVLDVGCGDGNFARSLQSLGFEMFGSDLSESGIRIAQNLGLSNRFAVASLYDPLLEPFESLDGVDAIISVEVVEHLYAPRLFMKRAYEALPPGGLLVLTTPYWGYLKNIALAVTNRTDHVLSALWDGGHIKHWSRATIQELIVEQGFEVVGFTGCGRAPYLWKGMVNVARKPAT